MGQRVVLIDNHPLEVESCVSSFGGRNFETLVARTEREGLKLVYAQRPDLIILDLSTCGADPWDTLGLLRDLADTPIIVLAASGEEHDLIRSFELGADDYLARPFTVRALTERVSAVLRRSRRCDSGSQSGVYDDGALRIELDLQQVWRHGNPVAMTRTELRLVGALLRRQGKVVSHQELLNEVWGTSADGKARARLTLYVRYVREKLEDDPDRPVYIQTRWGRGYSFEPRHVEPVAWSSMAPTLPKGIAA